MILVQKTNGTRLPFYVEYGRPGAVTVGDSSLIPRMEEFIDSLGDAEVFNTLDYSSGYWKIPLEQGDKEETTFACHAESIGSLQWHMVAQRASHIPEGFRYNPVEGEVQTALLYIEDIIIHSRSIEEHFVHSQEGVVKLYHAGVTLKFRKCSFLSDLADYLGHTIWPILLEIDKRNLMAVKQAKEPTNRTEIRSFIGLCEVYRKWTPKVREDASCPK